MAFPIEEQYILDAEKELNLVFPSSFKNKMMIENGGDVFLKMMIGKFSHFSINPIKQEKYVHATISCMKQKLRNNGLAFHYMPLRSLVMDAEII